MYQLIIKSINNEVIFKNLSMKNQLDDCLLQEIRDNIHQQFDIQDFSFVYKGIIVKKNQERLVKLPRVVMDNTITIVVLSNSIQKKFITCHLCQGNSCKNLGTIFYLPIQKICEVKRYVQRRFNLSIIEVLKKDIPLSLKQESIYTVAQVMEFKDNGLALYFRKTVPLAINTKKLVSIIEISDEEVSNEFSSKLNVPTNDEIEDANGLEKDRKIFFRNFITHNRTYLIQKERQTNLTTVYGIVAVAWYRLKSKLLMNMVSNLKCETSELLKWVDKINFYEFNLNSLERKMKLQKGDNLRKIEDEVFDELKRLKTAQINLEKSLENQNQSKIRNKEKRAEMDRNINIDLEKSDLEIIINDIKSDFLIYD